MKRTEHSEPQWKFPFVEYSPEKTDKKLPLILQLHGAGERGAGGEDLCKVDIHGFSKMAMEGEYECIFIMPQCPIGSFWAAHVESILAFVDQLKESYPIDEDRVYLTGLSMGGFGTWFTAMAKPDLFAAIAPVCGGGMPWNAGVLNMPVWAFHGTEDTVVLPHNTEDMVEKLQMLGKDVTYSRLEGVGHNAWTYAYNDALYSWLLDKRRS
ncbi:MAG: prolyl oligopeptidase family serine peptidase [Clostridia bacterium]|nr:prolyl oligopeptidase family serine peptidase [Clostridia bacterium]